MIHRYQGRIFAPLTLTRKKMYDFALSPIEWIKHKLNLGLNDFDTLIEITLFGEFEVNNDQSLDLISIYEVVNNDFVDINEQDITDEQLAQFIQDAHEEFDYWRELDQVAGDEALDRWKDER